MMILRVILLPLKFPGYYLRSNFGSRWGFATFVAGQSTAFGIKYHLRYKNRDNPDFSELPWPFGDVVYFGEGGVFTLGYRQAANVPARVRRLFLGSTPSAPPALPTLPTLDELRARYANSPDYTPPPNQYAMADITGQPDPRPPATTITMTEEVARAVQNGGRSITKIPYTQVALNFLGQDIVVHVNPTQTVLQRLFATREAYYRAIQIGENVYAFSENTIATHNFIRRELQLVGGADGYLARATQASESGPAGIIRFFGRDLQRPPVSQINLGAGILADYRASQSVTQAALVQEIESTQLRILRLQRLQRSPGGLQPYQQALLTQEIALLEELQASLPLTSSAAGLQEQRVASLLGLGGQTTILEQAELRLLTQAPVQSILTRPLYSFAELEASFPRIASILRSAGSVVRFSEKVFAPIAIGAEVYEGVSNHFILSQHAAALRNRPPGITDAQNELRMTIVDARFEAQHNVPAVVVALFDLFSNRVLSTTPIGGNRSGGSWPIGISQALSSINQEAGRQGLSGFPRNQLSNRFIRDIAILPRFSQGLAVFAEQQLGRFSFDAPVRNRSNGALQQDIIWSIDNRYDFAAQYQSTNPELSEYLEIQGQPTPGYMVAAELVQQLAANILRAPQRRDSAGRFYRDSPPFVAMVSGMDARWQQAINYVRQWLQNTFIIPAQQAIQSGGSSAYSAQGAMSPIIRGRHFWLYRERDRRLMEQTLRDMLAIVERDELLESGKKSLKLSNRLPIFPDDVPGLEAAVITVIRRLRYDLSLVRVRNPSPGQPAYSPAAEIVIGNSNALDPPPSNVLFADDGVTPLLADNGATYLLEG